jgi:hypothetical protein
MSTSALMQITLPEHFDCNPVDRIEMASDERIKTEAGSSE